MYLHTTMICHLKKRLEDIIQRKETDFGLAELKSWFVANDYLGFPGEKINFKKRCL
ncbi:Uncharacterised protein [Staphylococcus gallinarum]|uniref:Uncharacterized protein n=1 Tax=Staphylococcus gallinarum TaxID=1293 RepID=A0A380FEE6_STAGA|nr:Uncharacterised protein [Staphylococcus gallinarum]